MFFGAWVTLEAADGLRTRYRIVGPDEFDLAPGYISMDSPLGRALLRRALDDEVTVATARRRAGLRHRRDRVRAQLRA